MKRRYVCIAQSFIGLSGGDKIEYVCLVIPKPLYTWKRPPNLTTQIQDDLPRVTNQSNREPRGDLHTTGVCYQLKSTGYFNSETEILDSVT